MTGWKLTIKGYNPNQARVPAGQSGGGRWTSGAGGGQQRAGSAPSAKFDVDKKAASFLSDGLPGINSLGNKTTDKDGNPVFSGEVRPKVKAEVVKFYRCQMG
jgi:hypothetical protein